MVPSCPAELPDGQLGPPWAAIQVFDVAGVGLSGATCDRAAFTKRRLIYCIQVFWLNILYKIGAGLDCRASKLFLLKAQIVTFLAGAGSIRTSQLCCQRVTPWLQMQANKQTLCKQGLPTWALPASLCYGIIEFPELKNHTPGLTPVASFVWNWLKSFWTYFNHVIDKSVIYLIFGNKWNTRGSAVCMSIYRIVGIIMALSIYWFPLKADKPRVWSELGEKQGLSTL